MMSLLPPGGNGTMSRTGRAGYPVRPILPIHLSLSPLQRRLRGRVALGDEIGERLNARLVVVMIGERPGLSSPDSLGLYITSAPRIGRTDAERNCISNIHGRGLGYEEAAKRLGWLVSAALARGVTGVALKNESSSPSPVTGTSGGLTKNS